jgi:hypothetical protein
MLIKHGQAQPKENLRNGFSAIMKSRDNADYRALGMML